MYSSSLMFYELKVCQWLATGWFSLGTSTNKTDFQYITEILLKVALNTNKQTNKQTNKLYELKVTVYTNLLTGYILAVYL